MMILIDPYFPIKANPSKSKVIVLAAAIFGFFLTAFIILILEYFDTSMKTPLQVAKATKMKVAGAFPRLSSKSKANELLFVSRRLIDIIIQNIKLTLSKEVIKNDNSPYLIVMYSTQESAGKTLLSERIVNRLREIGDNVLYLNYSEDNDNIDDFNYSYHYRVTDNFIDIENLQQLISSKFLRKINKSYDYIFLELPSIVYNIYPIKLINSADMSLYIISANSTLAKADKTALATYEEVTLSKPMVIINEVELYNLDEFLSDVPSITKPDSLGKLKRMLASLFKYRLNINRKA